MSSRVSCVSPIILLKKQTNTDSDATEVFKSFVFMLKFHPGFLVTLKARRSRPLWNHKCFWASQRQVQIQSLLPKSAANLPWGFAEGDLVTRVSFCARTEIKIFQDFLKITIWKTLKVIHVEVNVCICAVTHNQF